MVESTIPICSWYLSSAYEEADLTTPAISAPLNRLVLVASSKTLTSAPTGVPEGVGRPTGLGELGELLKILFLKMTIEKAQKFSPYQMFQKLVADEPNFLQTHFLCQSSSECPVDPYEYAAPSLSLNLFLTSIFPI